MIFASDMTNQEFFRTNKTQIRKLEASERMATRLNRIASMTYTQYLQLQVLSRDHIRADVTAH